MDVYAHQREWLKVPHHQRNECVHGGGHCRINRDILYAGWYTKDHRISTSRQRLRHSTWAHDGAKICTEVWILSRSGSPTWTTRTTSTRHVGANLGPNRTNRTAQLARWSPNMPKLEVLTGKVTHGSPFLGSTIKTSPCVTMAKRPSGSPKICPKICLHCGPDVWTTTMPSKSPT